MQDSHIQPMRVGFILTSFHQASHLDAVTDAKTTWHLETGLWNTKNVFTRTIQNFILIMSSQCTSTKLKTVFVDSEQVFIAILLQQPVAIMLITMTSMLRPGGETENLM